MEMDAAAAATAAASASTVVACLAIDQVAQPSAECAATAPIVLPRGKKQITLEAWAAESKKRAARRVVAKQREKDKKAAEEMARQAEALQAIHSRAAAEVLAKQAAVHAVAMLKGEVVTQFGADQFGSTASSVLSAAVGWQCPASSALSSTLEPPSQQAAPSRLGVPTLSEAQFTVGGGMFHPAIDLNRTPIAGDTSSGHSKAPRARVAEDLPDAANLFGQMPSQPMVDKVPPWSCTLVHWFHLSNRGRCQYAGRYSAR
jgi:hypothetical protein